MSDGWGIPMATDIAFAVGVVALLGSRVPSPVKVLLLTLAIVDDIGAIVVIAVFYTDDLRAGMLLVAAVLAVVVWRDVSRERGVTRVLRGRRVRALAGGATSRACMPRSPASCWGC